LQPNNVTRRELPDRDLEPAEMRLNAGALALAFGVAGALEATLFIAVTGAMWGTMDGGVGSMHRSLGLGSGYGSMMAGGFGSFFSAVVCGFLGGALAGGVSAWVYNAAVSRQAPAHR
jgi:hypothetical protein